MSDRLKTHKYGVVAKPIPAVSLYYTDSQNLFSQVGRTDRFAGNDQLGPPLSNQEGKMKEYGIKDVTCDDLPRGVLIGSVELFDCDGGDWHVRKPERAVKLLKPKNQPQPVWFYPF